MEGQPDLVAAARDDSAHAKAQSAQVSDGSGSGSEDASSPSPPLNMPGTTAAAAAAAAADNNDGGGGKFVAMSNLVEVAGAEQFTKSVSQFAATRGYTIHQVLTKHC